MAIWNLTRIVLAPLMETHFNIQRRLFDYQFSLTQTPARWNKSISALSRPITPPLMRAYCRRAFVPDSAPCLGRSQRETVQPGRTRSQVFAGRVPRTTNRYGCVTLHSYHFYIEEGIPQTQVLLWVYGEQLRAVLDHVVLAEYHCRYDWRTRKVTNIGDGKFYPTRFASLQGSLLPLNPQESLVLYRPQLLRTRARLTFSAQQLMLFELVPTG